MQAAETASMTIVARPDLTALHCPAHCAAFSRTRTWCWLDSARLARSVSRRSFCSARLSLLMSTCTQMCDNVSPHRPCTITTLLESRVSPTVVQLLASCTSLQHRLILPSAELSATLRACCTHLVLALDQLHEVVHHAVVEVLSTQMCVARRGHHLHRCDISMMSA